MSAMLAPAVTMARSRLGGLIAVACAVAGGAAMATATGVLVESGIASHAPVERLAAADLTVSARQYVEQDEDVDVSLTERVPVPAGLAATVAAVDGVDTVAADVSFPATVVSADGAIRTDPAVAGHDWRIAELARADPAAAPEPGQIAIDSGLGLAETGNTVTVLVNGERHEFEVAGVVDVPGTGLYFDTDTAAAAAGHAEGETDLLAVTVDKGADVDEVAARVAAATSESGVEVNTKAGIGDVESLGSGAARGMLTALAASLGGTIVMIVGFITAGALSVSVAGQRRDLALLRAVGATPRQLRRLIATQATVVAGLAMPLGVAAGYLLAGRFADMLRSTGMLPEAVPLTWGPLPGIAAVGLLVLVVQVAARAASLRTSRMPAVEAVAESRVEPRDPAPVRVIAGFALMGLALAGTAVPLITRSEAAFISAASSILPALIGLALAGPAIVRATTGWLRRRLRPHGNVATWLAVGNSHGYALRMAGAITVLALAVGFAITQVFSQTAMRAVADEQLTGGNRADATVTAEPVGGLTGTDVSAIAGRPGIDAAVPLIRTTALWPFTEGDNRRADELPMLALGPEAASVVDVDVTTGDLRDLTGQTIALDASTAWIEGVEVGDRIELILADGSRVEPTLVATYDRGFGYGKLLGSTDLVTGNLANRHYDAVLLTGDTEALRSWTTANPGRRLSSGVAAAGLATGADSPDGWLNIVVSLALLGYILLGVGNSLVAATTRRRSEFAVLRLIGATPAQVRRMMGREAVIMTVLAVAAGWALSVLPQSVLGLGFLGLPWPQGPLWLIPAMAVLVAAIAWLATAIPTRRALRLPPTRALPAQD